MTLNITEKNIGGDLVPVLNVSTPGLCYQKERNIFKKYECKCFFTKKSEFSRSLENLKMTLNISAKNIRSVLVPVLNVSTPGLCSERKKYF